MELIPKAPREEQYSHVALFPAESVNKGGAAAPVAGSMHPASVGGGGCGEGGGGEGGGLAGGRLGGVQRPSIDPNEPKHNSV